VDDAGETWRRLDTLRLTAATPTGARFATDVGTLEIDAYAPDIIRLRGTLADAAAPADYGLLVGAPERSHVKVATVDGGYVLEAGTVGLELSSSPVRLRFMREGRAVLQSTTDGHIRGGLRLPAVAVRAGAGGPAWHVAFGLHSGEPVFGLGEKFGPLDRRGQLITSWNEDAWGVNSELAYKNAPFAWSPDGWGAFVHTTARVAHGVGYPQWSQRSYVVRVEDPALDVFLIAAPTPAALLERYTYLTGRSPLPPRWSYGVWMSRAWYRTADDALDAAKTLRARRIPCDVLTLDGRAWLVVETRFGFEWDRSRYPDPEAFARSIKALDYKLCVWEYPYVSIHNPLFAELAARGYLLRTEAGEPYVYHWDPRPFGTMLSQLPPSGMIDFTNPDAYAWYRDAHQKLFAQGVDVLKTDFAEQVPEDAVAFNGERGTRIHNVHALLFNKCVFEATERHAPGEGLVWGRSGWTGSQRYPIQWGGDPQSDWEGLAASIRGGLSWGMTGVPFHSHDIGGFYHVRSGAMPDPELYVRWTQAGVMASHTRFHGTSEREPWHYGDDVERIVRRWLEWRYRLIPYLQACAYEAHRTGMPVMRAMPLAFPGDRASWAFEEQYLLGPSLLVAPVLRPGGRVRLYLPAGRWWVIDESGGADETEVVDGARVIERTMTLETIPMYGRDGCLVPLGPAVQHTGELDPGVHIDEVWAFGRPRAGIAWPAMTIEPSLEAIQARWPLRRFGA
jgi:alpha-D-xyloside xylohydrolase